MARGGRATQPRDGEHDAAREDVDLRERDVLLALCRPLLDRDMFTEPASTRGPDTA